MLACVVIADRQGGAARVRNTLTVQSTDCALYISLARLAFSECLVWCYSTDCTTAPAIGSLVKPPAEAA